MASKYRHVYLLTSLLLLLLLNPFVRHGIAGISVLDILFITTLLTSIWTCASTRTRKVIAYGLAIAWQAVHWWDALAPTRFTLYANLVLGLAFFGVVTVMNLRQVLQGRKVTSDTIYGALSVYLLIGLVWVFAYNLLEAVEPNSFSFSDDRLGVKKFERFVGFSYVTLTTLGYGNIVPMTQRADALAIIEAIVGQIFLTVLVARLVGMQLTQANDTSNK